MSACVPLTVILPAEPAVSSCLPLVVAVLFFQSPILASPAGWSRLAANTKTHTKTNGQVDTHYDDRNRHIMTTTYSTCSVYTLYYYTVKALVPHGFCCEALN